MYAVILTQRLHISSCVKMTSQPAYIYHVVHGSDGWVAVSQQNVGAFIVNWFLNGHMERKTVLAFISSFLLMLFFKVSLH